MVMLLMISTEEKRQNDGDGNVSASTEEERNGMLVMKKVLSPIDGDDSKYRGREDGL